MSKVAWKGELILAAATWADNAGHKVKFKIVGGKEGPNPFKYFTKRRKGKAGTRFNAVLVHVWDDRSGDVEERYKVECELMLANWQDSSASGHSVEFWCPPPDEGMHVFEGFERNKDSFMAALVELDDDEEPIDQSARAVVEEAEKSPQRRSQRLSQVAALMCQNRSFLEYIVRDEPGHPYLPTKEQAADWMRKQLGIGSRSELDRNPAVAARFHEQIRKPFVTWQERHH